MIEEKLAQGNSFLHRLDGRAKALATAFLVIALSSTQSVGLSLLALVYSCVLILLAGHQIFMVMKRLLLVNTFTLLLWLILPLSYGGGDPVASFLFLDVYTSGIELALLITIKTNAILLFIMAVPATSTIATISYSLKRLGLPEKLCFLLLFSCRNISVMFKEYQKLLCAARMRNFTPATNLHTYKTYSHLFAMTLVESISLGKSTQEAMVLRGFDGTFRSLEKQQMLPVDHLFILGNALIGMVLFCWPLFSSLSRP